MPTDKKESSLLNAFRQKQNERKELKYKNAIDLKRQRLEEIRNRKSELNKIKNQDTTTYNLRRENPILKRKEYLDKKIKRIEEMRSRNLEKKNLRLNEIASRNERIKELRKDSPKLIALKDKYRKLKGENKIATRQSKPEDYAEKIKILKDHRARKQRFNDPKVKEFSRTILETLGLEHLKGLLDENNDDIDDPKIKYVQNLVKSNITKYKHKDSDKQLLINLNTVMKTILNQNLIMIDSDSSSEVENFNSTLNASDIVNALLDSEDIELISDMLELNNSKKTREINDFLNELIHSDFITTIGEDEFGSINIPTHILEAPSDIHEIEISDEFLPEIRDKRGIKSRRKKTIHSEKDIPFLTRKRWKHLKNRKKAQIDECISGAVSK